MYGWRRYFRGGKKPAFGQNGRQSKSPDMVKLSTPATESALRAETQNGKHKRKELAELPCHAGESYILNPSVATKKGLCTVSLYWVTLKLKIVVGKGGTGDAFPP